MKSPGKNFIFRYLLPVLIFSLFFGFLVSFASELICAGCGKPISGTYWKTSEKILCDECYQNIAPKCSVCGVRLTGRYWETKSGIVCDSCYQKTAPRCSVCGKIPAGRYWNTKDGIVCSDCYEIKGPKCWICGRLITSEYQMFPESGKRVCMECYNYYPKCKSCGAPTGPKAITIDTGFILCPECASRAILTIEQARPIFMEAESLVKRIFGMEVNFSTRNLYITDEKNLLSLSAKHSEYIPRKGVAGLHISMNNESFIYLLKGVSPDVALETLVHEYVHAWQARNTIDGQDLIFREGFAEWIAYKVLVYKRKQGRAEANLKDNDYIYGEGLRKMLKMEKRLRSPVCVIEYVKTHKSFDQ